MEAICDPHPYIWYFNFGEPGLLNAVNMLDRSSIVGAILTQKFDINGRLRYYLYFLVDGFILREQYL